MTDIYQGLSISHQRSECLWLMCAFIFDGDQNVICYIPHFIKFPRGVSWVTATFWLAMFKKVGQNMGNYNPHIIKVLNVSPALSPKTLCWHYKQAKPPIGFGLVLFWCEQKKSKYKHLNTSLPSLQPLERTSFPSGQSPDCTSTVHSLFASHAVSWHERPWIPRALGDGLRQCP